MKPLVWAKVPKNRLKGTVWERGDELPQIPKVDMAAFERLFQLPKPASAPALGRAGSSSSAVSALLLLDPKRANNLSIILKRLKMPFAEMRRAIIEADFDVLNPDTVAALLKCVPTAGEAELVAGAQSKDTPLGFAEEFVAQVGTIPRLQQRLECFRFFQSFNQMLVTLYLDVKTMHEAAQQLVQNDDLRSLLHFTLHLGNLCNVGSHRSGAEGFKLECLPRLAELRATGSPVTLLQFAIATLDDSEQAAAEGEEEEENEDQHFNMKANAMAAAFGGGVCSLAKRLSKVRKAAKLAPSEIAADVSAAEGGLAQVREELASLYKDSRSGAQRYETVVEGGGQDRFAAVMGPFVTGTTQQVEHLKKEYTDLLSSIDAAKTYFAEDKKATAEDFFSRWATFIGQLETAIANHQTDRRK